MIQQLIRQEIIDMSAGNSFNFGPISQVASGQGAVNQVGQNTATTTNSSGGPAVTADVVIQELQQAVPEESREQMEAEVFAPLRTEIQTLAAMPIADAEAQKQSFCDRATSYVAKLAPFADKVRKPALSFLETGLGCIAPPVGWFVAATLAAVRDLKQSA